MKKIPSYYRKVWDSFILPILFLILIVGIGIFGYMSIDHFPFIKALHMVVITITTAGFRPIADMSDKGLLFDAFFVFTGVIFIVVVVGRALEFLVSGELIELRRKRP